MNKKRGELLLKGILIFGMLVGMMSILTRTVRMSERGKVLAPALKEGWYILSDGVREEVTVPGKLTSQAGEPLILYNDSLTQEQAGMTIATKGAESGLRILLGDELLYEYQEGGFPKNEQMKAKVSCSAVLPQEIEGKTLTLLYEEPQEGETGVSAVWLGSGRNVFLRQCSEDSFMFILVFLMLMLSMGGTGCYLYLRHVRMRDPRFLNAAWFLLLCAVWCVADSTIGQQLAEESPALCYISFYAFMLLAAPMVEFVKNTGEMKKYRSLNVLENLFYVNVIVQSVCGALGWFSFVQMLFVTHLLLIAGVILLVVLLVREYRVKKDGQIRTVLTAFTLLALFGVLALVLYWLFSIGYYGNIFEAGILLFILVLMKSLMTAMVENLRFRTEAQVYWRLSREDSLTGMKNRRAYEEYLQKLEEEGDPGCNALLIYMDLNDLKTANDNFGHNAGDELIITAAGCIRRVFEKEGECFRIGGDEFCAILPDVKESAQIWFARLDEELMRWNNAKYRLSMAKGASFLMGEDGRRKSFSDWKYEADQRMYDNKRSGRDGKEETNGL